MPKLSRLFQARLSTIGDGRPSEGTSDDLDRSERPDRLAPEESAHVADQGAVSAGQLDAGGGQKATANAGKRSRSSSARALGKTVRLRDKNHRKFILRQPCLVCGRVPSDPHHLTFTQPRALGRRVSDEFMVPVCRVHHRELHRSGDEATWWRRLNVDPIPVALRLWQRTRAAGEIAPMAQAVKTPERTGRDAPTEPNPATQDLASDGVSEAGESPAGTRAPA
jgi:hypothetical protein